MSNHPSVDPGSIPRERRLWERGARASFIMATSEGKHKDSQPCEGCGTWTLAFCEACEDGIPPCAICTYCDGCKIICNRCLGQNKTFEQAQQNHETRRGEDGIEVTGFQDDTGAFIRFPKPLLVPASRVPTTETGEVDMESLAQIIQQHAMLLASDASSSQK